MAKIELRIINHPAQARHPFTNQPLVDDQNRPVPLFPDQRAISIDGGGILAYVVPVKAAGTWKVLFIKPKQQLGVIVEMACKLVEEQLGPIEKKHVITELAEELQSEIEDE